MTGDRHIVGAHAAALQFGDGVSSDDDDDQQAAAAVPIRLTLIHGHQRLTVHLHHNCCHVYRIGPRSGVALMPCDGHERFVAAPARSVVPTSRRPLWPTGFALSSHQSSDSTSC